MQKTSDFAIFKLLSFIFLFEFQIPATIEEFDFLRKLKGRGIVVLFTVH